MLTPERLFGDPPLLGATPSRIDFSPDGGALTFLRPAPDDRERLDLWQYEVATGALYELVRGDVLAAAVEPGALTPAEKAERERRRMFAGGVTNYHWHPDGRRIILPLDGEVFVRAADAPDLLRLTPEGTRQTGVTCSPKGSWVSYVRSGDLYVCALSDGRERRLTADGGGLVTSGLPEFIAQEEMHRFEGHWWSPDDAWVAFARADESTVTETMRYEIDAASIEVVPQRYPFAGSSNARVTLHLIRPDGSELRDLPWAVDAEDYLARVAWSPDGTLVVQAQSRDQKRLRVRRFDPAGNVWTDLFEERWPTWINLHDNLTFAGADGSFFWTSERDGRSELYRFAGTPQPLATGLGRVNRVLGATPAAVFVTGWTNDPTCQHLYRIALDRPDRPEPLTEGEAWHEGALAPGGRYAAVTRSTPSQPANLELLDLTAGTTTAVVPNRIDPGHPYHEHLADHVAPTFGHVEAADGRPLQFRLTPPREREPGRRYPVVVSVYGGPGVQRVRREWAPLILQLFAQRGYGVLELDNRGSSNREKAFEDVIYGRLGHAEVEDQLRGVDYLKTLDWVDAERVGVFGHSYGGYMALMCLGQAPAAFAAGVSVAPVTDWALYDTHYTERYLETPANNPDGYRESAVFDALRELQRPLLLMHGMADDNVLFAHTTRLMKTLQDRRIAFELMTYPGAKHSMQEPSVAIHRFEAILAFFDRHLRP